MTDYLIDGVSLGEVYGNSADVLSGFQTLGNAINNVMLDAPRRAAEYAAISPTGPAPNTAILSPAWNPEKFPHRASL